MGTTISASPSIPSPPPSIVPTVSSTAALTSKADHTDSSSTPLDKSKAVQETKVSRLSTSLPDPDLQQVQYPSEGTDNIPQRDRSSASSISLRRDREGEQPRHRIQL